ncbi:2-iminoacetate synthase ThiH [Aliagarivorans taiwanensis]|uniref:2-iminoacetate synthase ThiH n=1 Tax=Aliagarivorans taiwanensis TaxID=561966 RepID=UPI0003F8787B|nr:2-iminoacetate synthase ThiH [Aliagarivorans taiwanensis]
MSFADTLSQFDDAALQLEINSISSAQVEQALAKSKLDLQDFKALISPAAEPYLEQMAQRSHALTQQRFGKTMQLYIPLYLSNMCSNVCDYCGFSMGNKLRRVTLDMDQLKSELEAIKDLGFDHILLVTGESERKVGMDYFRQAVPMVKQYFNHVSMEVQPLEQHEYQELIGMGLDAVMVYQETYKRPRYAEVHPKGKKRDFDFRLATAERLGDAGIRKIGIGALLGLDEWRSDSFYVAAHLQYLERRFWRTRFSISFPRLRPCEGGFQPKSVMSDRQLVQLICAYRLFNPDVELSLSTRESAHFRDHVFPLGITTMSAYSSTQPGGYSDATERALEQFEIDDGRHPDDIAEVVADKGYQVVWKDWDRALG